MITLTGKPPWVDDADVRPEALHPDPLLPFAEHCQQNYCGSLKKSSPDLLLLKLL